MLIKRFLYIVKKYYAKIVYVNSSIGLNSNYVLFICFSILAIVFLTLNIYKTIQKGERSYEVMLEEEAKRDDLLAQNQKLQEDLDYTSSKDSKSVLAADGYNLAERGEELYVIEREIEEYDYLEDEVIDPIQLDDNKFWWELVLLGRK